MKRIVCVVVLLLAVGFFPLRVSALEGDLFENEARQIEDSIPDDVKGRMDGLGASSAEEIISNGVDGEKLAQLGLDLLGRELSGPLAALPVLLAAVMLCSVVEGYTVSLRYTETRDIMAVAVSLFIASVTVSPVAELLHAAGEVIQGASAVMLLYLPVMAGMLAFSGHAVSASGWYAAVTAAAQGLSWLSATVLLPILRLFLTISVSAGVCGRVRLGGLTEALSKAFKWALTLATSIFVAVIGLNGTLFSATDRVADKAARFALGSLIPLIGSSISEAYGAIQGSVGVLRSGIGVFVILALVVSFLPLLIRNLLWAAAVYAVGLTADALGVSAAGSVLRAISAFLSALRALLIAVMTAFIISSSVMMRIGGAS